MPAENNLPVTPNPAFIIPLGEQAIKIAASTVPIYYRSDPRREFLTKVGAPVILTNGVDFETTGFEVLDFPQIKSLDLSKDVLSEISINDLYINLKTLIHSFEISWHALRTHESFIDADLNVERIPNLNVIVLADLWDQTASLSLIPVLYLLKRLSNYSTNTMIHVLLSTARFPSETKSSIQKARIYRLLTELENRIFPEKSLKNDPILKSLHLEESISLDYIRVYLFDSIKEQEVTVSGREELQSILSSFLLTILNGEISDSLTSSLTQEQMSLNREFFAGAGSTSIIYNPDPIIEYCAARLGAEYLPRDYWPKSGDDKTIVDKLLDDIRFKIGKEENWISKIISRTVFAFVQIENNWDIQYSLEDLILESPRADKIKECPWINNISEYYDQLVAQKIPIAKNEIKLTANLIKDELDQTQKMFDADLLQQVELHPNVLFNGRAMLFAWKTELEFKAQKTEELLTAIETAKDRGNRYTEALKNLNQTLEEFPSPPWIFKFIPEWKIKKIILSIYAALKLKKQYRKLDEAAANVKSALINIAVAPIKEVLLINLKLIPENLITRVVETHAAFDELETKLKKVQNNLEEEYPKHIPGVSVCEGYKHFQVYPANEKLTLHCFEKYAPHIEEIRIGLLGSMQFLKDWKAKDEASLTEILLGFGRKAYSSIRDMRIKEVFEETLSQDLDNTVTTNKLSKIGESTWCLLYPNWDFGESYGAVSIQNALLDYDGNPFFDSLVVDRWRNWQIFYTNDPYYYTFSKVQSRIPLQAISYLIEPGEECWNGFSLGEKNAADILPSQAIINPKVIIKEIENSDGDLIQKTFRWTFEPKGNPMPVEQEIVLKISRNRFEEFKSKPRYDQEYNRYAEEEMPEIRDLALAFQVLHSDHKWSTFNQAFNILTFVQSCIPYSFDKDTTPQSDWPRYPIETLMDGTGDCEDVAILCGAILARLGFSSALFAYPRHLAFGVQAVDGLKGDYVEDSSNKKKYYYGEATAKGWRLGEIPSDYKNSPPDKIYPITLVVAE